MRDLTQGSIRSHVLLLAAPTAMASLLQALYQFVELYLIAGLGNQALAAVSTAGSAAFVSFGLAQALNVGTTALIAHAVGRRDPQEANLVFMQGFSLALILALVTLGGGYAGAHLYARTMVADEATAAAGVTYLRWLLPGLALQFVFSAMAGAVRGTGVTRSVSLAVSAATVVRIVAAPVLILGWGTERPLGVAGAGLAATAGTIVSVIVLWLHTRRQSYLLPPKIFCRPQVAYYKKLLAIGLPAGMQFMLLFIYASLLFWACRPFGVEVQAAVGIGSRVMQVVVLPAMAVGFAAAMVAGQNFGAGSATRVRSTFREALWINVAVMSLLSLLCSWKPSWVIGVFASDPSVGEVAGKFLAIVSIGLIADGVNCTVSGMFRALGNTWPGLLTALSRLATFAVPVVWLTSKGQLELHKLWYLSVGTVALQAAINLALLKHQFVTRLPALAGTVAPMKLAAADNVSAAR